MKNVVNRALVAEKKVYSCPATEVIAVNVTYGICQSVSKNAPLNNGGGTDIVDPNQGI